MNLVINNMAKDICQLNWNYPIYAYCNEIPSQYYINNIYNALGIIDYYDYTYNVLSNA